MGIFRSLLAIAVVIYHSGGICGYDITGGIVSVQSFYIISGFYMSFILSEKYMVGNNKLFLFFTNRLFRLMPVYYFFLLIKILISFFSIQYNFYPAKQSHTLLYFINYYHLMDIKTLAFLLFTNIFVIGQDICLFIWLWG